MIKDLGQHHIPNEKFGFHFLGCGGDLNACGCLFVFMVASSHSEHSSGFDASAELPP